MTYQPDTRPHQLQIEGETIAYYELGTHDMPTLVLIHGLAESGTYFWMPIVERLGTEFRIITFDILGHGNSSTPDYHRFNLLRQIRIYARFIELVSDHYPVRVIGHSLGGIIGANLAVYFPHLVDRLVMYDTPVPRGPLKNGLLALDMKPLAYIALSPLAIPFIGHAIDRFGTRAFQKFVVEQLMRIWRVPFNPADFTDDMAENLSNNTGVGLEQQLRTFFLYHDLQRMLHRVQQPVLQILGDTDVLYSIRRAYEIAGMMPNCRTEIVSKSGHLALYDQTDEFLSKLVPFLQD